MGQMREMPIAPTQSKNEKEKSNGHDIKKKVNGLEIGIQCIIPRCIMWRVRL